MASCVFEAYCCIHQGQSDPVELRFTIFICPRTCRYYIMCDSEQTRFVLSVYGLHSDAVRIFFNEAPRVLYFFTVYVLLLNFHWFIKVFCSSLRI